MFCSQCGSKLNEGAKFCPNCGAPVQHNVPETPSTQASKAGETQPAVKKAQSQQTVQSPQSSQSSAAAATSATVHRHALSRPAWIGIIAAIVAVVVALAAFITYCMNVWGVEAVPYIDTKSTSAGDAVIYLKQQGFKVKRSREYSSAKKGQYLRMDGAQAGEKVSRSTPLTVVESLGPGVPQGTVGKTKDEAVKTVKTMGVKVSVVPVVSEKTGTVLATSPSDGKAVTDAEKDTGIQLAVGVKGKGVPVEIAGMDKDAAKKSLESAGFKVTLKATMASKKNIGKVVQTNPEIGEQTDTTDVTVYYGADADGVKKAMLRTYNDTSFSYSAYDDLEPFVGKWCTDAGDCLTLGSYNPFKTAVYDDSKYPSVRYLTLNNKNYAAGFGLSACSFAQNVGNCDPNKPTDGFKNLLLSGNSGVIEIFDNNPYPYCGTRALSGPGIWCDNGTPRDWEENNQSGTSYTSTGLEYRMSDYLLAVPVGANISEVEQSNYFLNKNGGDVPDESRPYVLLRDEKQYDETKVSGDKAIDQKADGYDFNPFIPNPIRKGKSTVKFAPYPSAKTAYYKVEDPIDWEELSNDAEVICPANGCATDEKTSASADNMSISQIRQSLEKGDFTPIAGTYCNKKNACFTVNKDGTVPRSEDIENNKKTQPHVTTKDDSMQWRTNTKTDIELVGPDSDATCKSQVTGEVKVGNKACFVNSKEHYLPENVTRPLSLVYYPKGTDLMADSDLTDMLNSAVKDGQQLPDSSRPYMEVRQVPLASMPVDSWVYYLQEK